MIGLIQKHITAKYGKMLGAYTKKVKLTDFQRDLKLTFADSYGTSSNHRTAKCR